MHDLTQSNPILWAILAVEVAFWLTLALGLATRYVLRMPRASTIILLCVPLLDLVLIALTVIDLSGGVEPDWVHALAVVYLGFTIGFGHATIAWADRWFAYRFAGGPRPPRPSKSGPEYVRRMWAEWRRVVVDMGHRPARTPRSHLGGRRRPARGLGRAVGGPAVVDGAAAHCGRGDLVRCRAVVRDGVPMGGRARAGRRKGSAATVGLGSAV